MTVAPAVDIGLFERFCSEVVLENGERMTLEPFQASMLEDFFGGCSETLILLPKKNGKTSLVAALALFHLLVEPDAECVIGAHSRDQATIVHRQAAGLVRRSPTLRTAFDEKKGYREIRALHDDGRMRVLAADAATGDGVIPSLAIVDELHRHRTTELYGVFRDGLGPRNGRLITISTAGDDELGPLGVMRAKAQQLEDQRRDGSYRRYRSANGQFALHEWALDADQDRDDVELVKTANPASWQTVERLRERHDSPSTTPWQWARFACGVWVRGEDTAIDPRDWDQPGVCQPGVTIPDGSSIYLGWDNAFRGPDTTALVPVWIESRERRVIGDPVVLTPPEEGMLDDRDIVDAVLDFKQRYQIVALVFDPNAGAAALAQQIERDHGITMVEHSQQDSPMALADSRFREALRRLELVHSGHDVLRQHVLNAVEKSVTGERFRFTRPQHGARKPIDCLTAASMAHSTAVADMDIEPVGPSEWLMF